MHFRGISAFCLLSLKRWVRARAAKSPNPLVLVHGVAQHGAAWLRMVQRGSVWCGMAQYGAAWLSNGAAWLTMVRRGSDGAAWLSMVRRGSLWCGVAQLVARRLAVRQARVRFSARHHREGLSH